MFLNIQPSLDTLIVEHMLALKFNAIGSILKLIPANRTTKITKQILKGFIRVWVFVFLDMKGPHFFEIKSFGYFSNFLSQLQQFFVCHVVHVDFIVVLVIIFITPIFSQHLVPEGLEMLAELFEDGGRCDGSGLAVRLEALRRRI